MDQQPNQQAGQIPAPMPEAKLPDASKIFNEAWELYKSHYKNLVPIAALPIAAIVAFNLIFIKRNASGAVTLNYIDGFGMYAIILAIAVTALIMLISLWSSVAMLYAIKHQDEVISWDQAFLKSQNKIWPFFITGVLSFLAAMGGFILLIVPGIIFTLWFSQSTFIVIEEDLKGIAALKRSKYYIKNRIGETFGKLFFFGLVTVAFNIVFGIAVVIIVAIASATFKIEPNDLSWIGNLWGIAWTPLATLFGYQLYRHLKTTRP